MAWQAGELVGRKRASVGELRALLASADATQLEEMGGMDRVQARPRSSCACPFACRPARPAQPCASKPLPTLGHPHMQAQLALDTTLYKGGVASLKEIKAEIERLQAAMQRSQAQMHADFEEWRAGHLAASRSSAAASGKATVVPSRGGGAPPARRAPRLACADWTNQAVGSGLGLGTASLPGSGRPPSPSATSSWPPSSRKEAWGM